MKWKIYAIGLVPFLFFLITVLSTIKENYHLFKEARSLKSKIAVIEAASAVVHESQKERGKSAGYLNGGVTIESLNDQRKVNDTRQIALKHIVEKSEFSEDYKNDLLAELGKYDSLRGKVNSKSIPLGQALKSYTGIIKKFLNIELDVARSTSLPSIAAKIKGFRILEDAKESGGKLRANMTAILAKDGPITDNKFSTIVSLKAGVDAGIKSSGLTLDPKSIQYISNFKTSKQWKTVREVFQLILKNSGKGSYGQNPARFFSTITGALNILGELIIHQKDELISAVNKVQEKSTSLLWVNSAMLGILLLGVFGFVSYMSKSITKKILSVITSLKSSSGEISSSSQSIAATSIQLNEAAQKQALSIKTTVASIDEIRAMIQRNSAASENSNESSEKSKDEAIRGKASIDEMITSISEIEKSNQEIISEMNNNKEQINKITTVISEIGEKTKVINDIVFQTKLLSFNASVEAAKAGEHGKGFAVVAAEIGNLAKMSGSAAAEISEMLDSSIEHVNAIINSSGEKIEVLVNNGSKKVERGKGIAYKCGDALERILKNITSVNEMVKEISIATNKQSAGVSEISTSISQLDQVTNDNASAAESSASMAAQLKANAQELNISVRELVVVVEGGRAVAI